MKLKLRKNSKLRNKKNPNSWNTTNTKIKTWCKKIIRRYKFDSTH